jgi:hypothetical protein
MADAEVGVDTEDMVVNRREHRVAFRGRERKRETEDWQRDKRWRQSVCADDKWPARGPIAKVPTFSRKTMVLPRGVRDGLDAPMMPGLGWRRLSTARQRMIVPQFMRPY